MRSNKFCLVLLALALSFSLAACKEEENTPLFNSGPSSNATTRDDVVHDRVNDNADTGVDDVSASEKVEKEGSDYSVDYVYATGNSVHGRHLPSDSRCKALRTDAYISQEEFLGELYDEGEIEKDRVTLNHSRKEFKVEEKDGSYTQFGGDWPDNKFTRMIPNPGVKFDVVILKDNEFGTVFGKNATIAQMKDYAKQLKKTGFMEKAETHETPGAGFFSYEAKNRAGYAIELICIGTCNFGIRSPKS